MTKFIRALSAAALASGLALSLAASADAQDAPPPPPGAAAGPDHHWDPAKMQARMAERRQHRQQILHDALGIRGDQEGAWQAFASSTHRPDGQEGRGMRHRDGEGAGERAELTTPQRLDRMAQRMSERQARFAQRSAAIKTFYAALDSRQQKTFDALVMTRMGHGGMGGGMGDWGHDGRRLRPANAASRDLPGPSSPASSGRSKLTFRISHVCLVGAAWVPRLNRGMTAPARPAPSSGARRRRHSFR